MKQAQDIAWWYWFFTVGLLGAGLFGWPSGIYFAIALCLVQIGHVFWLTRDHCLSHASPAGLSHHAHCRIVRSVAVDSLGAIGRNHRTGRDRLLLSGADSVPRALETLAAAHIGADPTDLLFATDGCTVLPLNCFAGCRLERVQG